MTIERFPLPNIKQILQFGYLIKNGKVNLSIDNDANFSIVVVGKGMFISQKTSDGNCLGRMGSTFTCIEIAGPSGSTCTEACMHLGVPVEQQSNDSGTINNVPFYKPSHYPLLEGITDFNGATPSFDVIEKTKEYTNQPGYRSFNLKEIPSNYYSDDYLFRGPIVGPINRQELVQTNAQFALQESFPDLDRYAFGFTVDPENPFRVLYFERWKATHTGDLNFAAAFTAKATGRKCVQPVMPFSIVWTPDGTIIYEHLTTAVDRFEGNTMGKVAVFGLLETAGISLSNNVGDLKLTLQQKFNRFLNGPAQIYSKPEDVPSWWKSTAVGAEPNDM